MRVIAYLGLHPNRRVVLELTVRIAAAILVAILILGVLPAITEAVA